MSAADAAVGMMDGAYFTSRNELLTFFNTLLNLQLTKIEQTASGAVACQLTEYLFPNSIPMSKVNWSAKSSHEYVGNYKLLQKAFTKNKVQRYVDVDKLIRGKYQDNLEFCQWLKAFFDMQNGANADRREDYDPVAVRAKGKGGKTVPVMTKGGSSGSSRARAAAPVRSSSSMSVSSGRSANNAPPVVGKARIGSSASSSTSLSSARAAPSAAVPSARSSPRRMTSSSSATTTTSTASTAVRSSRPARERPVPTQKENNIATNLVPKTSRKPSTTTSTTTTTTTTTSSSSSSSTISNAQIKKYQEEIKTLRTQNTTLQTQLTDLQLLSTELELNMTTVESERDFYFEKLRGIEVMLQVYKEKEESGELLSPRGSGGGEMKRVIEKIFKVMYAAAEDNVMVDDEGNLVGDITMDESVVQNNESFGSIRPHAQDELVNDDDDDDDELLTSGIVDPVEAPPVAVEQQVKDVAQLSDDDDDDDDDDELLTSGIISPVNEVVLASSSSDAVEHIGVVAAPDLDDDEDDDDEDELLTSGIDSGDEAAPEVDASNRDAENDRIISQLVGNNDHGGVSDEELLVDDASQDEY